MRRDPFKALLAMSDRERLLLTILSHLGPYTEGPFTQSRIEPIGAHWISEDPQPGDLVQCLTQYRSTWSWAWLEDHGDYINDKHCWAQGDVSKTQGRYAACFLLREIGGNRVIHMGNERLNVLRGIPKSEMLEGHQFKFYVKVQKAFWKLDAYSECKIAGIDFTTRDAKRATIGVRPHIFSAPRPGNPPDGQRWVQRPITFEMDFNPRTTIRQITERIRSTGPWDWEAVTELAMGGSGVCTLTVVAPGASR